MTWIEEMLPDEHYEFVAVALPVRANSAPYSATAATPPFFIAGVGRSQNGDRQVFDMDADSAVRE